MEEKMIDDLIKNIQIQKETILLNRILEVTGQHFDWQIEKQRRFPRLKCIIEKNFEKWYIDDGSIHGLFVAMFTQPKIITSDMLKSPMNSFKIDIGFQWSAVENL